MKISVNIITKNASKTLEGAIQSIKGVVDEIVIVDTGSTDDTVTIAKKYTKKVYQIPFSQDFSRVRNYAISKSTGAWVFVLDVDEIPSEELKKQIPELIKQRMYDGFWFRRRWYLDQNMFLHHGLFYPDYQMRLFRNNPQNLYINRVHEKNTVVRSRTKQMALDIYHYDSIYKYLSWNGFQQLDGYVRMQALMHKEKRNGTVILLWKAVYTFFDMFFVGLTRGKGIFDGWVGVKAHFFFALSIAKGYIEAIPIWS